MASLRTVGWHTKVAIAVLLFAAFAQATSEGLLTSYLKGIFNAEVDKDFNHMLISNGSGTEYVYIGAVDAVFQLHTNLTHIRNDSTDMNPTIAAQLPQLQIHAHF